MLRKTAFLISLLMLVLAVAQADEQFGVAVYPGAKYDEPRSTALMRNPQVKGVAFRTDDPIPKVMDFYRKQGLLLLKAGGASKERARFKQMEKNVDVVVQQPWRDPRTNAVMQDTLILIMQERTPVR